MNYGEIVNDFLVEVRERGGFANDRDFDLIVGQVFFDKIKAAIEDERDGLNPDYAFTFTPREQWIIRLFLKGLEIEEVSAQIGSPIERVQQIKTRIIKKLEHSEQLRAKRNLTTGKEGRF